LYKICGVWRSVRLEAAKRLLLFFVPKVPSRVRISKASLSNLSEVQFTIICLTFSIIAKLAP
jgi:hypothetical protein